MMDRHTMRDLRESMKVAKSLPAARNIVTWARSRLADVRFIGWPALEQSLQRELDDVLAIAKERGFAL